MLDTTRVLSGNRAFTIAREEHWFLTGPYGDDWDFETHYRVYNEGGGTVFHCPFDWGEKHCRNFIEHAANPVGTHRQIAAALLD